MTDLVPLEPDPVTGRARPVPRPTEIRISSNDLELAEAKIASMIVQVATGSQLDPEAFAGLLITEAGRRMEACGFTRLQALQSVWDDVRARRIVP